MAIDFSAVPFEKDTTDAQARLSGVATPEVLAAGNVESPEVGFKPIDSQTFKREQTRPDAEVFLDKRDISMPFSDDIALAIAGSSGKNISPYAVKTLGYTPREVLNSAIVSGLISPNFEPDESMGALKPYWDQYKAQMQDDSSLLGATMRGAKESIIPAAFGIAGAALGSIAKPVGMAQGALTGFGWGDSIPEKLTGAAIGAGVGMLSSELAGGIAGSALGAEIQEAAFPKDTQEKAQAIFDAAKTDTRFARAIGNVLPAFATGRPGTAATKDMVKTALVTAGIHIGQLASKIYKGEKLTTQEFLERFFVDLAATALTLKPNAAGRYLFDKQYRAESTAAQRRTAIFQKALEGRTPKDTQANIDQVISMIQEAQPLLRDDLNLGVGNMSNNPRLLGMQAALERQSDLIGKRLQAKESVSSQLQSKIGQKGMAEGEAPVPMEATQEFFAKQNADRLASMEAVRQEIISAGDTEGAAIWSDAKELIQKIGDKAANNVISAEEASLQAIAALNQAKLRYSNFRGILNAEDASRAAKVSFDTNLELRTAQYLESLKRIAKEGEPVTTDLANAYKAALRLSKPATRANQGGRAKSEIAQGVPLEKEIEGIKLIAAPRANGAIPKHTIYKAHAELRRINSAIREAVPKSETSRRLNEIKTALLKDINAMGEKSDLLRESQAFYKNEIADVFLNGKAESLYNVDPSNFADHFMSGSIEDMRQFRKAISDSNGRLSEDALNGMEMWLLNNLNNKLGVDASPEKLSAWYKQNQDDKIFNAFPELRGKTQEIISNIEDAKVAVDAALNAKNSAEVQQKQDIETNNRFQMFAMKQREEAISGAIKKADDYIAKETKAMADTAATRYLGPEPDKAIAKILENTNIKRINELKQLMAAAAQDPTGIATIGLQNAFRKYLQERFARYGSNTTQSNNPADAVSYENLEVSLRALNAELEPTSVYRQAMDLMLPRQEVAAMELARKQLQILNRRYALTSGESSTQYNTITDQVLNSVLSGNLLDTVFTLGRAFDPSSRSKIARTAESIANAIKWTWKGDTAALTKDFMVDAMSNPQVAIEAMRGITPENLPRAKAFLRAWTLSRQRGVDYAPLPFGVTDSTEESLANGTITTDTRYGYKIIQTKRGNFEVYSPSGNPLGLYKTKQEAEVRSADHFNSILSKQK